VIIPVVNHNDRRITVTPSDIVHQRRLAAVAHAIEIGNVAEAARRAGVSRKSLHAWKTLFEAYGPDGLRPKAQRRPAPSNATPDHVISRLVQLAVTDPGGGARSYAAALSDDDYRISKSGVQTHLNRLGLGRRGQRFAAAARLALFSEGLVAPDALGAAKEGPFGFSHWAPAPGVWVQVDCFYIGKLKGVGEIWQITGTDVRTRISDVLIVAGRPTSQATARFLDLLRRRWARRGFPLGGVISDNGGEFKATFALRADQLGIRLHRIPARSPNHNAVVERFHQTMLEHCWRPAFHRRFFTSTRQLQAQANSWLVTYHNTPNHGEWMRGATPNHQLATDRPE
jgi:transposase InsO family protein